MCVRLVSEKVHSLVPQKIVQSIMQICSMGILDMHAVHGPTQSCQHTTHIRNKQILLTSNKNMSAVGIHAKRFF